MYLPFFRHIDLSFHQSSSSDVLSDVSIYHFHQSPLSVVFCHCILSFYSVTLSSAIFTVIFQRRHIMSFASVVFLSRSHLSSSLGILNLSFTILLSLHSVIPLCHSLVMCFCSLHVAFDMSICNFAYVILFCHVLLSFFCRVHCHLPLPSFDVFIWHSVAVVYSRVLLLTCFDMGEEGHA